MPGQSKQQIMKQKITVLVLIAVIGLLLSSFIGSKDLNLIKTDKIQDTINKDSLKTGKLKLFKKNAHASYYAQKFHGRRTASGKRFDNTKYTAAHRKFSFGTKLKVTNEANGKSVIVEITDRGPFTKGRDIDLTKKAFMEIASNKYGGSLKVTIEEVVK
jgi:rare lipoprotein A